MNASYALRKKYSEVVLSEESSLRFFKEPKVPLATQKAQNVRKRTKRVPLMWYGTIFGSINIIKNFFGSSNFILNVLEKLFLNLLKMVLETEEPKKILYWSKIVLYQFFFWTLCRKFNFIYFLLLKPEITSSIYFIQQLSKTISSTVGHYFI